MARSTPAQKPRGCAKTTRRQPSSLWSIIVVSPSPCLRIAYCSAPPSRLSWHSAIREWKPLPPIPHPDLLRWSPGHWHPANNSTPPSMPSRIISPSPAAWICRQSSHTRPIVMLIELLRNLPQGDGKNLHRGNLVNRWFQQRLWLTYQLPSRTRMGNYRIIT